MKIVHVIFNSPYTEGLHYQDNLLTKFHRKAGHDVTIIASKYQYNRLGQLEKNNTIVDVNKYGVRIIRLEIKGDKDFWYKFKRYVGLYEALKVENPDVIFIHGIQSLDIDVILRYKRDVERRAGKVIRLYGDSHGDYSNSARNWLSKNILHKVIWKRYVRKVSKHAEKIYGTLPCRVTFMKELYGVDGEFLPMGVDDDEVRRLDIEGSRIREKIRKETYTEDKFVIITGGKIDKYKLGVLNLIRAVKEIPGVELWVFGSIELSYIKEFTSLIGSNVRYLGWLDYESAYNYVYASDLVVFPSRHSVYWEMCAGIGKPMVVKYQEGIGHLPCTKMLYSCTKDEIVDVLKSIINNRYEYKLMVDKAKAGREVFWHKYNGNVKEVAYMEV
ncbi:MAG: glycosyltransferase [Candidatus Anstonellales archaeon]